jgi:hypothetical protein
MASSPGGLLAEPFLWACLGAFLAGAAATQALGAWRAPSRRGARLSRSALLLGLALLCLTGLLVLAGAPRARAALGSGLVPCSAVALALGALSGARPLALGLPLLVLAAVPLVLLRLGLEGWLPLRPPAGEGARAVEIARLLPYEVDATRARVQLELIERDSVPVAQDLVLGAAAVSLRLESLALAGPLRLAAVLVLPERRKPAYGEGEDGPARFYRVVGLGGMDFARPRYATLLDALLPPPAEGAEGSSALFGLARRDARSSPAAPLSALRPLAFSLSADGAAVEAADSSSRAAAP